MEFDRSVSRDFIIRFQTRLFQIQNMGKRLPRTGGKVFVCMRLDGSVHIFWKDRPLPVKEIPTMFDE